MERVTKTPSDDDDESTFLEQGGEEEEDKLEIDDITCSSEESGVDNNGVSNSLNPLTDEVKAIWYKRRSKLVHECTQVCWFLSLNRKIMEDAKEHTASE